MLGSAKPISRSVEAKLRKARVARLATVNGKREPRLVPVCFVFDGSVFYTAIDRKPKKVAPQKLARLKNIENNPQVALLIDEYREDWKRLWWVLVRGTARALPDTAQAERAKAVRQLRRKYPQYAAGMLAGDATLIRITPQRTTSWGL